MRRPKHTKEQLEPLVRESLSLAEVLRKLGKKSWNGGVQQTLRKYIKHYAIDASHLLGQAASVGERKKGGTQKRRWEDVLIEGRREKAVALRRALLESGREYRCLGGCGNDGTWLGKELRLHVHHEDGNHKNNRPENLNFLCPNCHGQTDNWGHNGGGTSVSSEAKQARIRRRKKWLSGGI